jgi:hypothetical protein
MMWILTLMANDNTTDDPTTHNARTTLNHNRSAMRHRLSDANTRVATDQSAPGDVHAEWVGE